MFNYQQPEPSSAHPIFNLTHGTGSVEFNTSAENNTDFPQFGMELVPPPRARLTSEELDIVSRVYEYSFDQQGCRMIQQRLEDNCTPDFVAALVNSMSGFLPEVMGNQFGNYLC